MLLPVLGLLDVRVALVTQSTTRTIYVHKSDTNKVSSWAERPTGRGCHFPCSNWTLSGPTRFPRTTGSGRPEPSLLYLVKQEFSRRMYCLRRSTAPSLHLAIVLVFSTLLTFDLKWEAGSAEYSYPGKWCRDSQAISGTTIVPVSQLDQRGCTEWVLWGPGRRWECIWQLSDRWTMQRWETTGFTDFVWRNKSSRFTLYFSWSSSRAAPTRSSLEMDYQWVSYLNPRQ